MSEIRIKSVLLKNFKKHADREVHFNDTLTVICGPNYSGKSSILEAIFFALFGTRAVPGGAEVITRTGGDSKAGVSLIITIGENEFCITRTPTSASVSTVAGEHGPGPESAVLAAGHTAVTDWILTRIGTGNIKRALALAFSSQGETQAILQMGAPALNAMLEELTGVKYVDRLIELAGKRVDEAERTLDRLGTMETSFEELMTIQSDTELELETQQRKLEELKPKVDQLQSSLSSVRKELDEAHAHNEMVQERNLKIRELKTKVETYKTSYKSLMNELEGMGSVPDTSDLEATLSQAVTELERMEAEAEAYEEEQHESDKHTDWLEKNEDVLLEKASNLETYEVMSSTLKKTEARMNTAAEAFTTAKNEETQAKNAEKNAVCGECQRPFDQKHLDAIQKKLPALTRKRNETQREFEKVESKVTELRTELAKLSRKLPPDDWKEQIDTHKALAAVSANRLAKLPSPSGDALITQRANVDELKARKKTIALEIKRHSEAKSRVAVAKENLDHNQAELNLTKPLTMVAVDGLLDRQGKAYEAWAEAREGLTATTEAVNALKRELADLNLRVKKARQHREETSTAEAAKARYTKFGRWLKENKAAFLNDTWSGILALVSEFSSEVTSGAIEEVGREPDGDFWYREDGHVRPILAASGGQRSIIGVGLRLALPSLLPAALGFVALDEASADLNEDRAAALAGALRTSGRQVILVTHRQGEEFSSDAVVVLE